MNHHLFYDFDGNPISQAEWTVLFDKADDRIIGKTTVGEILVSTVWLGLDHSFGEGPIKIYETMIFGLGFENEFCARYSNLEEAQAGHLAACEFAFGVSEEELANAVERTEAIAEDLESSVNP